MEKSEFARMLLSQDQEAQTPETTDKRAFARQLLGDQPSPAQSQYIAEHMQGRMYNPQMGGLADPEHMERATTAMSNALSTGGGAIAKTLRTIDIPRSAVVSGIKVAQGQIPLSDFGKSVSEHPSYSEVLPDMPVNLFDYNNVKPDDILSMAEPVTANPQNIQGVSKDVNFRKGAGFAMDIAGDPVTWLTAGILTKTGKLGRDVTRLASVYGDDAVAGVLKGSPDAINALKGHGVPENMLKAIQRESARYMDDIAKLTAQHGDTLITELLKGNPNAVMQLQGAKVSDKTVKALTNLGKPLQTTLTGQAKAGQWAAAKLGPFTTPKAINVPVAKAIDKTYETLPKIPGLNKFINYSGDRKWDAGVKVLDRNNRIAKNEIMDVGLETRKNLDSLGENAFSGKSSVGWFESEGGVWMDNLVNGNFGKKQVEPATLAKINTVNKMNPSQMTDAATQHIGDLMKKDFPEIAGMKPYFAPGPGETPASYALHQIAGQGGKQGPRATRTKSMYLLEDSLSKPDFVFTQANGRKYFGSVYDIDNNGVLHTVIAELEPTGRIREITQFSYGDKKVNEITKEIRKKFGDSKLEYLGESIKKGVLTRPSNTPPSLLLGPDASFAGTANTNIVNNSDEAVKLGMAQKNKRLLDGQLQTMQGHGIPVNDINELGSYAYAPHIVPDETAGQWATRKFRSEGKTLPTTKTPHSLHREYRWITDPKTGEETIGSVSAFAKKNNLDPEKLISRNATVDEINGALGKNLFKTDLAETTTIAALRNQNAIYGAEQINYFTSRAAADIEKIGGLDNVPKNWVTPQLQVPKRFISKDNKTFPINDALAKLQNTPMPPEKARILEGRWKSVVYPDKTTKELEKLYSGYISAWKRYTLMPFAEYHTRNAVGDIWNGWMHGWQPHQIGIDIKEAAMNQLGRGGGIKTSLYGKISNEDLIKVARDYGVTRTGQWGEISNILAPISSKQGHKVLDKIKREAWDLETVTKIGDFLESNRRLALFSRQLKQGATYEEAANVVTKALFDYNDLTAFEKSIRQNLVPFYTWYRKNVPAQIENLIRHPGKVAVLPKTKAAIESSFGSNIEEEMRPEWMRREYSISLGKNDEGKENFAMLGSYIPTADLFKYSGSAKDIMTNAVSNLCPAIKVPFELAMNKDFFRDKPIDRLRDKDAAPWERGGVLRGNERTNYLGMDMPTTTQRMTELLPFTRALSTLDRLNPGGIFDRSENEREYGQKPRPYHNEMSTKQKLLKAITGLKNYPVDSDWEAYRVMKEIKGDYELSPGFDLANLRAAARRAEREGDKKSGLFYEALAELLEKKAEKKEAMWRRYEEGN